MRINLDVYESIYTYDDLKDTLDLKRIAIYTRNDERDLQEMVCKDFLEDNPCTFSTINIYKDKRTGTSMQSKTMKHLSEDISNKKIDTIICLSLDRLTRNVFDLTYLLQLFSQNNVRLLALH